ncbi:MAG: CBS domain-containing protein [Gilvibacter sp.]
MENQSVVDIMTKDVVSIAPNQDILDVKHIYEKKEFHHHIPVIDNEKLVGMISLVDFMYHISGAGLSDDNKVYKTLKVKDIMMPQPFSLNTDASVNDVAAVLSKGRYHAVPILENDKLVGIVSTADVIKHFLQKG